MQSFQEAREALRRLHRELDERNQSAARSLAEGLEETLTVHRLGGYGLLGRSLTTNCLESIHAMRDSCLDCQHSGQSGGGSKPRGCPPQQPALKAEHIDAAMAYAAELAREESLLPLLLE